MAIRWKVPFVSLRTSTTYTVNIYDDQYSGQPVTLTGGARPFVTDEYDSDDLYVPVLTQTGYLRIIDDGTINWRAIIPATNTSRRVTLTDAQGTIHWQGYLQPNTFSGILYEPVQERNYPLVCGLSVLDGIEAGFTSGVKTFAEVLRDILIATGHSWSMLHFCGLDVYNWLAKKVNTANFIEYDANGNAMMKYSCLELLREICKFWGWTCRTYRDGIYFMSPDVAFSPELTGITISDLDDIIAGDVPSYQSGSYAFVDTDNDVYASDNNQTEIHRGVRKVSVTANINKQDDLLSFDFGELKNLLKDGTVVRHTQGDMTYFDIRGLYDGYDTKNYELQLYWDQGVTRASVGLHDEVETAKESYKHNYDWKPRISINYQGTTGYAARIISKNFFSLSDGIITINGGTYSPSNGYFQMRLRIGDDYWNGASWTNAESAFNVYFGVEDGSGSDPVTGKIFDNRVLSSSRPAYEGYGIPISGVQIGGTMVVEIVGVYLDNQMATTAWLTSFTIGFVKNTGSFSDLSENKYIEDTNSDFSDEFDVSTIFASNNGNQFGFGLIMHPSGAYCSDVAYSLRTQVLQARPEEFLLSRLDTMGNKTRTIERVEVLKNEISIDPHTMIDTHEISGYPTCISNDWRDDVVRVTITEM